MSDFKAIETQEELDRIIQERLSRQKESLEKQYSGYDELKGRYSELEKEVGTYKSTAEQLSESVKLFDQEKSELNAKIASYETASLRTKIALQNGLPFDLADRLVGTDEESLKADAERLAGFVSKPQPIAPLKSPEIPVGEKKDGAYKTLVENLNLEGE